MCLILLYRCTVTSQLIQITLRHENGCDTHLCSLYNLLMPILKTLPHNKQRHIFLKKRSLPSSSLYLPATTHHSLSHHAIVPQGVQQKEDFKECYCLTLLDIYSRRSCLLSTNMAAVISPFINVTDCKCQKSVQLQKWLN